MSDTRKIPRELRAGSRSRELGFTGERIVPQAGNCEPTFASRMYQEHIARYIFAGQLVQGRSVIDVGCGVGYGSRRLAELGASSIHAFDLSEGAIRHARKHYKHPRIRYAVGNAEHFTTEEKFDVAVCFELIEHVRNPRKVLANIRRLLSSEGILIMSTPRALEDKRTHFHEHEFELDEFVSCIKEYFPNVELYAENNHFSSLVTKSQPLQLTRIECLKEQFELAVADVFVAVASSSSVPLPPMEPVLALDNDAYVRTLERDVEILRKAEADLRERIDSIETQRLGEVAFKDAEIARLTGEYQALFDQSEKLKKDLWQAQQTRSEDASKDAEIARLIGEYQKLFSRSEELSKRLWEAGQRESEINEKESEISRLTAQCNALRERTVNLSNLLQESEMKHAELQQEQQELRQELELLAVRSADADSRRLDAYEFARISSDQALALRRELEILRRDLANALDFPASVAAEKADSGRHHDIVSAMERLFLGTEATHDIARDPLVDRIARLSLELREQRTRAEDYAREMGALQEFQREAEDWHRQLLSIRKSVSWRITTPLRWATRPFRAGRRNG